MPNPAQVASQIRFALSELPAHNAHHTFEHICRHLTRQFICSNVLPATGPVSAGGDQGRDFETFRTYLRNELGPHGGFLGLVSEGTIAFVCTMQARNIVAKVAQDINTICESGQPVHEIKAFSLHPVPVSARHGLESQAQELHDVGLQLFDGQAIAEQLASPEGFWIAEQFLALPADLRPSQQGDDEGLSARYVELRRRWRERRTPNPTLGDLIDLKTGLREATFNDAPRADLPFWLGLIRELLADDALPASVRQRARYELAVATLRGLGDLRPVDEVVRAYLDASLTECEPVRLEDASVLLMYVNGAARHGVTAINTNELAKWHAGLRRRVERLIAGASPNRRASLLFVLGYLGLHPTLTQEGLPRVPTEPPERGGWDRNTPPTTTPADVMTPNDVLGDVPLIMSAWTQLAEGLEQTPLFPVHSLSEQLRALTPALCDHPGWRVLVDLVDRSVARVSGRSAVAAVARDRAMALLRAGRRLEALSEFHQVKIDWWSGDTIRGSLLAMLMIARLYLELRLPAAAKAYGLAVVFSATPSADEDVADLLPAGLLMAAQADFAAGTWCGATELFELGLKAQHHFIEGGLDSEDQEAVQSAILHLTYINACARDLDPTLAATVARAGSRAGVQEFIEDLLERGQAPARGRWASFGSDDLAGPPFSDLGETLCIRFAALGTDWHLKSPNDVESVRAAERFAAAAQMMLAELAREDLCIVPTRITVLIQQRRHAAQNLSETVEGLPSNDGRIWKVRLAPAATPPGDGPDEVNRELLAILTRILIEVSLLPQAEFLAIMKRAFQRGLGHMLSPARPYDELAGAAVSEEHFSETGRGQYSAPWDCLHGSYAAHGDLRWHEAPGPTYSSDQAEEMARNRYLSCASTLQKTVPALRKSAEFIATVKALRTAGWLDWHILTAILNVVLNYRHSWTDRDLRQPGARAEMVRAAFEPEHDSSRLAPAELFTPHAMQQARHMGMLALVQRWGLECRQETPDFAAVERLLAARYGYWDDDVAHEDPFPDAV